MTITYAEFDAVDIRVGRITRAEPFPEARKPAIKLWVDFGPGIGEKRSFFMDFPGCRGVASHGVGRKEKYVSVSA